MSEILIAIEIDGLTNSVTERPLTSEEIAEREAMQAQSEIDKNTHEAERIAKEEAKANGMAKLIALGLTEEEAGALING
jgi:hypothetical protein